MTEDLEGNATDRALTTGRIGRLAPLILIFALCMMALKGPGNAAYNVHAAVHCAYYQAFWQSPAPNVLLVGTSHTGHAFDSTYMRKRILATTGETVTIEKLALTYPDIPQFHPLIDRYIAERGAPDHVFLQLLFNTRPQSQRKWDMPVNDLRNISFAPMSDIIEIQRSAKLNDYGTVLPRWMEAGYLTLPAVALQKVEANVFSTARGMPLNLTGKSNLCRSVVAQVEKKWIWPNDLVYDGMPFELDPAYLEERDRHRSIRDSFLPLDLHSPSRIFEVDQFRKLIKRFEDAGSQVHLFILPVLEETEVDPQVLADLAEFFPDQNVFHPFSLYDSEIGDQLKISFVDENHMTPFGALHVSRYFADVIAELEE